MKIDNKIWNVESTCDGEHDGQIYFTLSFVTPTLEDPENSEGIITPLKWHLPYEINIDFHSKWKLVLYDNTINDISGITKINYSLSCQDECSDIRKVFEAKLKDAIKDQIKPYSADSLIASRQETGKSTLPHELAGLNQLPKPLSEFLFKATVTVKFDKSQLNPTPNSHIIGLYPAKFEIEGESFTFDSTSKVNTAIVNKNPSIEILQIDYKSNNQTPFTFKLKDIIQQDNANTPESAPNIFAGSSLVFLNDTSISGRLDILARNFNAFRILSVSIKNYPKLIKQKAGGTALDINKIEKFIYSILLKGVLRESFTVFDSSFATEFGINSSELDKLKNYVKDKESIEFTKSWFDESNKYYNDWKKLKENLNLSNLADFLELLANESIKEVKESAFWVDWLYFVCVESTITSDEKIKSLLTAILQDSVVRNRLLLRPYFKGNTSEPLKNELLNCDKKPDKATLENSLDKGKLKPLVDLILTIGINELEPNVKNEVLQALLFTANQIYDEHSALPDDWGISIKLEDKNSKNKDIRGYSIALCSVNPSNKDSILESVWLTNRKVIWQNKLEKKFLKDNDSDLKVDRPHGGFKSQGEQVLSINYYGDGTGLSESDGSQKLNTAIRFVSLDVNEMEEKQINNSAYPKLGYGMYYRSAATSILNSGLVVDENFRKGNNDIGIYTLKESSEISYKDESKQFLCRVKPAAPSIAEAEANAYNVNKDEAIARDSLATIVYKESPSDKKTHTSPPIYLLSKKDNKFWSDETQSLELTIDRPRTSYNVFERWINTELVYKNNVKMEQFRDPYFKNKDNAYLDYLIAKFLGKNSDLEDKSQPPHPAVRAVGIILTNALTGKEYADIVTIDEYEKYLDGEKLQTTIKLKATIDDSTEQVKCNANVINIKLKSGHFYKICLYSLIPRSLCEGKLTRVQEDILKDTENQLVKWQSNNEYYQGAASEFLIESLADINFDHNKIKSLHSQVSVDHTTGAGALVTLNIAELDSTFARIFSGFEIEQHRWRWTGYPSEIDIAKSDGLQEAQLNLRLMDYWGARSRHYEAIEKDAKNQNQLDGRWQVSITNSNFIIKPQKLHDWYFKGIHGAHHGVYLLKPRLMYQSLIQESYLRDIKAQINNISYQNENVRPFLVNAVLPIHDYNFKLPPLKIAYSAPVLEWDKPNSDSSSLVHAGSGAMCVFEEVFYRNDDMGLFGGLAERYEISLVPTRIKGLHQIGPDPVFHPQPNVKKFTKNAEELSAELNLPYLTNNIPKDDLLNQLNWKVEHTPFYGLTKDGGINHKNNQTATNLYLTGNFTHQYDILAQVRTRRWLEPTLVEGAEIKVGQNANFLLPKRFDKQDWVPIDYCVYDGKSKRELVSWHKGKWNNTSDEIWRRNIITQELTITNHGQDFKWLTTDEKTPYEDKEKYEDESDANPFDLKKIYHPITSNIKVFKWITSDYSEGTWMTFLGAPWRNQSFASKSFGLLYANDRMKIKKSSLSFNKTLEATTEFIVEDLIIHPLADSYYLGSNEQWLKEEQHRFNILFVYETFKPEDQADSDEKYCKLHSLWHPTRDKNKKTQSPSKLNFVPLDKGIKLIKGNHYIGAIYEFYCENINDEETKKIKNYLLNVDKNGKDLNVDKNGKDLNVYKNGVDRLIKLWFPEMQGENIARPLLIMRPPMMGYMPLYFDERDLDKALDSKIHKNTELKYLIENIQDRKVNFELYLNEAESFWEVYKKNKLPEDCSILEATKGSIVGNGCDIYCMNHNGNAVLKLSRNDKSLSAKVIQKNGWSSEWKVTTVTGS